MSQHQQNMHYDDIHQNLKKIGPTYSHMAEKQDQIVQMIKRQEVRAELKTNINMDIQGLRKKNTPFLMKPNNTRLWQTLSSSERNGQINIGISRNFTRFMFPFISMFFFMYTLMPVMHGTVYEKHYNNFQWAGSYYKFGANRMVITDMSITRLA